MRVLRYFAEGADAGRHSVLVAGHDYLSESRVDFSEAAINLWQRIRGKGKCDRNSSNGEIILFDFSRGTICSITTAEDQVLAQKKLASYAPPLPEHYKQTPQANPYFAATQLRTLSILDVYSYLYWIGVHRPGTIESLMFVSHAWDDGPILLNTIDPYPKTPWHSSGDKDGRRKDLVHPQLDTCSRSAMRNAFVPIEGFCINSGCGGHKELQPLLLRLEQGPKWSDRECHTLKRAAMRSWCQYFADAAQIYCFGAFPGISTGIELHGNMPTLSAPQQAIADRPDFSPALDEIESRLGFRRDPWGLGLSRFSPRRSDELL